jgi:hypothetical protein
VFSDVKPDPRFRQRSTSERFHREARLKILRPKLPEKRGSCVRIRASEIPIHSNTDEVFFMGRFRLYVR